MISINTVALYVTDQERSKRFYVDVLGFEVRNDAEMGAMGRWLEVAPPGSPTALVLADAKGFDRMDRVGNSADITLRCDDIQALHRELSARDVSVSELEKQEWGTFVTVVDPDGHSLLIRG